MPRPGSEWSIAAQASESLPEEVPPQATPSKILRRDVPAAQHSAPHPGVPPHPQQQHGQHHRGAASSIISSFATLFKWFLCAHSWHCTCTLLACRPHVLYGGTTWHSRLRLLLPAKVISGSKVTARGCSVALCTRKRPVQRCNIICAAVEGHHRSSHADQAPTNPPPPQQQQEQQQFAHQPPHQLRSQAPQGPGQVSAAHLCVLNSLQ